MSSIKMKDLSLTLISIAVLGNGYRSYERWLNDIHTQGTGYQQIYKECVLPSPCWMLWREDL